MQRAIRWSLLCLLALFAGIQFVPVERTNPPVGTRLVAPPEVQRILERSCFDCHSNETRWPWYSRVAPASWFLSKHVKNGRGDLNFTEWPALDDEMVDHAMHEIEEQVSEGKMPLKSYLILHRDAKLRTADQEVLVRWAGRGESESDDD